ncbi:MAG: substrate-binding domain-containing protein [Bacteroidales bacterium]|nr:substrate-binding domain-containing protein [Bacteroidales bacterium]
MKNQLLVAVLLSILLIVNCKSDQSDENEQVNPSIKLEGEINIAGADALLPLVEVWVSGFQVGHENLDINVSGGGTGLGLEKLAKGEIDMAMISRELTSDEACLGLICWPVSKEGVIPIVNQDNPLIDVILEKGFERSTFKKLYSESKTWNWGEILHTSDNDEVKVYTRSDLSGAADIWAKYLGLQTGQLNGIGVEGDADMVQAVINEPFAIGYCNAHYAFDFTSKKPFEGLVIVPIDLNCNGRLDSFEKFYDRLCTVHRAAYLGKFPNLLCREIMLVTRGVPNDPAIISFLDWIYTKGQIISEKSGYSRMRQCVIEDYTDVLDSLLIQK